nr:hypothetical protein GCM10023233_03850 [Brevibacterium otitidis]
MRARNARTLATESETLRIAEKLGIGSEVLAEQIVQDLGTSAANELYQYVSTHAIDVDANLNEVENLNGADFSTAGFKCGKARTAAYLFGIWGTAICGAAAASSVGALGVPCTILLTIGSNELDWNRVCKK